MARSLQERLRALEQSVGRSHASEEADGRESAEAEAEAAPATHPLQALGFTRVEDERGGCWVRVLRYDLLTLHGYVRFGDLMTCQLQALWRAARQDGLAVEDLRFYDTETTGLGTGAGTIPFLHAVGRVEGDDFTVYQYFLDDYGDEAGLLQQMMTRHFSGDVSIVSFNGKSFDWPLLKNRLNLYRQAVPDIAHVDLLYPSRRLWKQRLPRVSLGTVEASVLGLQRSDDLPGSEAPNRYFEYIDTRDASLVAPVLDHNATDVCSLVTLTCVLAQTLNGERTMDWASEQVAVGRYYDEWQEYDLARQCYVEALECPDADWRDHWLYSLHLKRRGMWEEAVQVWTTMADAYPWSVQPTVELAKHCEHRSRDLTVALEWAELALRRAKAQVYAERRQTGRAAPVPTNYADPVVAALEHRCQRIHRKLERREVAPN